MMYQGAAVLADSALRVSLTEPPINEASGRRQPGA
jgi:hypothetical protein